MRRGLGWFLSVSIVSVVGCGGGSGTGGPGVTGAGATGVGATGGDNTGGNTGATGGSISTGTGGTGTGGTGTVLPPASFSLTSPAASASAQPLTPDLQWTASLGAVTYTVEVATDPSFGATDVVNQSIDASATDFTIPAGSLDPGVIYYWQVTAWNGGGSTPAAGVAQWFSSPYLIPGAHGVAATPDGRALVVASDVNNGPVEIVTLASHLITSISTGVASQPMGIAVSPDGTEALATLLTNGNGGVNGVAVVDLTTGAVSQIISDPCVATTLSDVAYFPSGTDAAVPDLSPSCAGMGLSTFSISASGGSTFVNFNDTNDPLGVAIAPSGLFALVTMQLDDQLYRVDFPGVSALTLSAPSSGVAITPDGATAVVAEATADLITLADGSITPISLLNGDAPNSDFHNVAITPDGAVAVVVGTASIEMISLATKAVLASYPIGSGTSVAVSPDGRTAFVTDRADGWVRVVPIP